MSSKFLLFHQFGTKTHAFAHIHPQSVTTLLLASGNYRPRHSTLPLGITWLKHTTCVLLFVSMYSLPWSATKYKAVRVHSQILQISAIVTCPDSYVTFHKCCGHWWHDSRRHPKCYLGRLGALHLKISKFWGLWGMCELTPWILELQMTLGNLSHLEAIKHCKLIELELSTSEFKDLWIPSCCQRRKYLRKSPWPTDQNTFAEKQRCLTLTAMF